MFNMKDKAKNEFFEPNFKGAKVLSELVSTVGALGEDETIKLLTEARKVNAYKFKDKNDWFFNDLFSHICRIIYEETHVRIETLRNDRNLDEIKYISISYACRSLQQYCKWSKKDLQLYFCRNRTSIYKYEKYLSGLHQKINQKIIEKIDRMESRVREHYEHLTEKIKNNG